jgi:hypothetical protein
MDGIDNAMESLEKYDYDNDADLIKWLRSKADALDVPSIVSRLDKYLEG